MSVMASGLPSALTTNPVTGVASQAGPLELPTGAVALRPAKQVCDPADMGTAFGLEASLEAEADQAGFNPMHAAGAEGRAASDLPHGMTDRLNRRSVI